jgi:hypothetical protein
MDGSTESRKVHKSHTNAFFWKFQGQQTRKILISSGQKMIGRLRGYEEMRGNGMEENFSSSYLYDEWV